MIKNVGDKVLPRGAFLGAGLLTLTLSSGIGAAVSGESLVNSKCASCHAADANGELDRINAGRRTPEGWDMTVDRMSYAHGVKLTLEERGAIVKYLADNYGLAPDETAHSRYIIDRSPSVVEHPKNQLIADTCARCHSYGRIAVQRRTEDDWRKLVHFHVGQFPAIEIQAGGRDRNWFEIATGDVSKALADEYGFGSEAWRQWKSAKAKEPSGQWRVVGHMPGRGGYEGEASITRSGDDRYKVSMTLRYQDGKSELATGNAILYTGHEWRATVKQGGKEIRQVFSLRDGGNTLSGRWFEAESDAIGGTLQAVRSNEGGSGRLLSVMPSAIRAGTKGALTINGVALSGNVEIGGHIKVGKVLERSAGRIVVEYEAPASVATGEVEVRVGAAQSSSILATYQQIDYVKVVPEHPMARVGGGGGSRPKVPAQLEAVAYANGPDAKAGTADDVRLGAMPAKWQMGNLNEVAEKMRDTDFAGELTQSGLFVPAAAGPNPKRKYGTNNAGELKVTATVQDGNRKLSATAPLIVTVQRFNDPSIR